jgi:hypothetical protein
VIALERIPKVQIEKCFRSGMPVAELRQRLRVEMKAEKLKVALA